MHVCTSVLRSENRMIHGIFYSENQIIHVLLYFEGSMNHHLITETKSRDTAQKIPHSMNLNHVYLQLSKSVSMSVTGFLCLCAFSLCVEQCLCVRVRVCEEYLLVEEQLHDYCSQGNRGADMVKKTLQHLHPSLQRTRISTHTEETFFCLSLCTCFKCYHSNKRTLSVVISAIDVGARPRSAQRLTQQTAITSW